MQGKRGQGLSTNAIILIILGVVILAILILGFTIGWNTFLPFLKTNNVQNVKTSCNLACSEGNTYNFCSENQTINDGTHPSFMATCAQLSNSTSNAYKVGDYASYGISNCPSISCPHK